MSLLWWRISMRHLGPRECNVMTSRDLMTSHSWGVTSRCDGSWERVTSHVHVVMETFFRFTSLWVYVTYVDREGLMCLFFPWLTAWIAEAKFKAAFWGLMSLFVTGVFIKFMVFIEASYYFGWKIKFSFHLPFSIMGVTRIRYLRYLSCLIETRNCTFLFDICNSRFCRVLYPSFLPSTFKRHEEMSPVL